ncbi:YwaF family protein [Salinibacillus xinjiangensis]|uniref:TIGR02206 family membrane protein n=1 Tax=Salinibacillus xinjiangensis TaxID=1229268 RepID=A0A6G1X3S7_9BACI|nr:TIGR02206 family membrane protein [Salinibacillus xinjiangensis]MRG85602.1 TIGR02206 family membrane protein [Salinibacillus xinjiangensis]
MFESYFSPTNPGQSFQLFSQSHIVVIAIGLLLCVILFVNGKKLKPANLHDWLRYILIGVLAISEVSLNIWYITTGAWNVKETLPLQLCSISLLMSIIMLITKSRKLFEVVYFLGIGGAIQAILTPELFDGFPHYRYFHFFVAHFSIILASLYMVVVEGLRVTFCSVLWAMLVLNGIAVIIYFINKVIDANYMFLAHKPTNLSVLDYLPDFPWYIIYLECIAFVVFILLYLPFKFR